MKTFFFLLLTFFSLNAQAALRVLTYSSLLDKGGLGEEITKEALKKNIAIEFVSSKDFAGILGTLRREKREKKQDIDVVLGLNENNYHNALTEELVLEGKVFEEASFSILVNKNILPEKEWPQDWAEVKTKLATKLLVQDPRTSEVGLSWLLNATTLKNLSLDDAKKIPKKVFPTWSASFEAFEAGLAPAIWTYSTSAAYYQCSNDKNAKAYANLPLPSYPKDKNFVAAVKKQKNSPDTLNFIELVLSDTIQKQIWQKNWMFPAAYSESKAAINANTKVAPPSCFSKVWFPSDAKAVGSLLPKELLKRLDQWSL